MADIGSVYFTLSLNFWPGSVYIARKYVLSYWILQLFWVSHLCLKIFQKEPSYLTQSESGSDVRNKLLKSVLFVRRINERDRDRWDRLSLIKSEVSSASISAYYRLPLERTRLRWKQLTAWIPSEYTKLPSERPRLRWKQLTAWITSEYTRLPSERTKLRRKQLTAWITSEYTRLPSERTKLRRKQLTAWITSEYTRLPSERTRPKVNKRFVWNQWHLPIRIRKHSSQRGIWILLNPIFHLEFAKPWLMSNQ